MRALWNLTLVELKLFLREPSAAFFTLALPVLLLVLNGASASAGPDAADRLLPGYVAMVIATAGITVLPGVLASYREKGVLRRYRVTPVAPTAVLGAQLVLQVLVATLGLAILVAVGVAVAARLVTTLRGPGAPTLSAREREVLAQVARGASNRDIADRLSISEATVKSHLLHVFDKLGVDDRTAAVTVALQRGLLTLD
jgi:DNA-binding CsgD family transcriptional regulator